MHSARITILYDDHLQRITKKGREVSVVNDNISFIDFLHFLFLSYPEIQQQYPPGTLGFTVNGQAPKETDGLHDGDEIQMIGVS